MAITAGKEQVFFLKITRAEGILNIQCKVTKTLRAAIVKASGAMETRELGVRGSCRGLRNFELHQKLEATDPVLWQVLTFAGTDAEQGVTLQPTVARTRDQLAEFAKKAKDWMVDFYKGVVQPIEIQATVDVTDLSPPLRVT